MYDAAELAYQAFFFDNSKQNEPFILVGHFKRKGADKVWDDVGSENERKWFTSYYSPKV